mmetsp:Transcript_9223/g.21819  ORF Transcript_9223/g.21819 Transcript_9223/m.21819 type:complete len:206 (-) Transcript_9223:157-774(-)
MPLLLRYGLALILHPLLNGHACQCVQLGKFLREVFALCFALDFAGRLIRLRVDTGPSPLISKICLETNVDRDFGTGLLAGTPGLVLDVFRCFAEGAFQRLHQALLPLPAFRCIVAPHRCVTRRPGCTRCLGLGTAEAEQGTTMRVVGTVTRRIKLAQLFHCCLYSRINHRARLLLRNELCQLRHEVLSLEQQVIDLLVNFILLVF